MLILDRERSRDTYITQATTFTDFSSITEECRDDVEDPRRFHDTEEGEKEEEDRGRRSAVRTPNHHHRNGTRVTSSTRQKQRPTQSQASSNKKSSLNEHHTKPLTERDDARNFWSGGSRKSKSKSKSRSRSNATKGDANNVHPRTPSMTKKQQQRGAVIYKSRGVSDDTHTPPPPPIEQLYLETTPTRTTSTLTKSLFDSSDDDDDDGGDGGSSDDEETIQMLSGVNNTHTTTTTTTTENNRNSSKKTQKYEMKVRRFEDDEESLMSTNGMMIHAAPTMRMMMSGDTTTNCNQDSDDEDDNEDQNEDKDNDKDDSAGRMRGSNNRCATSKSKIAEKSIVNNNQNNEDNGTKSLYCNTKDNAAAATQMAWSFHPKGAVQATANGNKSGTPPVSSPFRQAGAGVGGMCDIQSPMSIFNSMRAKVMSCVTPNLSSYDTPPSGSSSAHHHNEKFHSFREAAASQCNGVDDEKYTSFSETHAAIMKRRSSSSGTGGNGKVGMGSLQAKMHNRMKGLEMEIASRNSDEQTSQVSE